MLSLVVLAVLRMLNQFYSFSGGCIVDLRTEKMCHCFDIVQGMKKKLVLFCRFEDDKMFISDF